MRTDRDLVDDEVATVFVLVAALRVPTLRLRLWKSATGGNPGAILPIKRRATRNLRKQRSNIMRAEWCSWTRGQLGTKENPKSRSCLKLVH